LQLLSPGIPAAPLGDVERAATNQVEGLLQLLGRGVQWVVADEGAPVVDVGGDRREESIAATALVAGQVVLPLWRGPDPAAQLAGRSVSSVEVVVGLAVRPDRVVDLGVGGRRVEREISGVLQ